MFLPELSWDILEFVGLNDVKTSNSQYKYAYFNALDPAFK